MEVQKYNVELHNKLRVNATLTPAEKIELKKEQEIIFKKIKDIISISRNPENYKLAKSTNDKKGQSFQFIFPSHKEFDNYKNLEKNSEFVTGNNLTGKSFYIFRTEDGKFIARIKDMKTGEVAYIPDMTPQDFFSSVVNKNIELDLGV